MSDLHHVSCVCYTRASRNDNNSTAVQGDEMKIKPEHYAIIEKWTLKAIESNYSFETYLKYLDTCPEQKAKIKIPARRYVWDMFWSGRQLSLKQSCELIKTLDAVYEYAHDEHLETALKKITGIKF